MEEKKSPKPHARVEVPELSKGPGTHTPPGPDKSKYAYLPRRVQVIWEAWQIAFAKNATIPTNFDASLLEDMAEIYGLGQAAGRLEALEKLQEAFVPHETTPDLLDDERNVGRPCLGAGE